MSPSEINRANSQHSTGPKTDEGKEKSSLNALRHGLTGQRVIVPNEDRLAYQRHLKSFQDHLQPSGPVEAILVQTLVDTAWRLNHVTRLETKLLNSEEPLETQIKALSNLSLYTQRLTRQFEKTERHLRELQDLRKKTKEIPALPPQMASFFQTPDSTPATAQSAPTGPWPLPSEGAGNVIIVVP
jgi:hypothetical protein